MKSQRKKGCDCIIKDTEENRRIFKKTMRGFVVHCLLHDGRYDEDFDRWFTQFVKGSLDDYRLRFTLNVELADNDRVFMALLLKEKQ